MTDQELLDRYRPLAPATRLVWTAIVDVADRVDLGPVAGGHRFIVPILGGRFYSGPGFDGLDGEVLPGGADRQLLRPDGVKTLDALYEMQTHSGTVITVHNKVITDEDYQPERYAMSVISATVQNGPFDWLNRRLLIGTLQSARPSRQAVIIRAWEAVPQFPGQDTA